MSSPHFDPQFIALVFRSVIKASLSPSGVTYMPSVLEDSLACKRFSEILSPDEDVATRSRFSPASIAIHFPRHQSNHLKYEI